MSVNFPLQLKCRLGNSHQLKIT